MATACECNVKIDLSNCTDREYACVPGKRKRVTPRIPSSNIGWSRTVKARKAMGRPPVPRPRPPPPLVAFDRPNNASRATSSMEGVFGEGSFKRVYKGAYTHGERAGQPCVMKVVRKTEAGAQNDRYIESVFDQELDITAKSQDIVNRFNAAQCCSSPVFLNRPAVWTFEEGAGAWAGVKCLVEPFIEGFTKYNSNSGWTPGDKAEAWGDVMQALSHFSYHVTGGGFVLCDLQGGAHRGGVVLTDPVVMSRDRRYGAADLGPDGLAAFFARHKCSRYCRPGWQKPRAKAGQAQLIDPVSGTSMMDSKGSMMQPSRPPRAPLGGIAERPIKEEPEGEREDGEVAASP